MWTARAKMADHPAGNWDFPGDIHFLLPEGHDFLGSLTHRYRCRSRQWITIFLFCMEEENFFQILCFAQTSDIFFLSGCLDCFWLVQRQPLQKPPELLARNQPCL